MDNAGTCASCCVPVERVKRLIEIREIYQAGIPELTSLSKDAQSDRAPRDSANIAWQCCQPEDQLEVIGRNILNMFSKRGKNLYLPGLQSVSREQIESKTFDMVRAGDQLSFNISRQMTPWLLILQ